jgi:hypothetical protein
MADLSDIERTTASQRGRILDETEPRAASARYDAKHRTVVVRLKNGCTFSFPAGLAQGLEHATDAQLANIEILGAGYGLRWESLDVDFTVPGLLNGLFGTAAYMARRAGATTTPAKAAAARANGAKGGRPRKAAG